MSDISVLNPQHQPASDNEPANSSHLSFLHCTYQNALGMLLFHMKRLNERCWGSLTKPRTTCLQSEEITGKDRL